MINYSKKFWNVDPNSIPPIAPGSKKNREIAGGPLIKLGALQSLLASGTFDIDQLWLATEKCVKDLQKEKWTVEDVLHMFMGLDGEKDHYKSEWCEVIGARMVPCDVYRIPFDAMRKCRHPKGLLVYLKFSVEEDGWLTITLASCHAA